MQFVHKRINLKCLQNNDNIISVPLCHLLDAELSSIEALRIILYETYWKTYIFVHEKETENVVFIISSIC